MWFVDNITINLVQPSSRKSLLVDEFSENLKYALLHLKIIFQFLKILQCYIKHIVHVKS